jgi:hypothetical protein
MAENQVTVHIGGDLSDLERDTKKLGSALDGAARGGIAGFEAAQQKVIDLTKRVGELRNALLQTSDPAAQGRLNAALGQTQKELQAAKTQMRGMSMETREASEKAQLLAASLGIQLPAAAAQLITRMRGVQQALDLAFKATAVLAIIALIVQLVSELDKLRDKVLVIGAYFLEYEAKAAAAIQRWLGLSSAQMDFMARFAQGEREAIQRAEEIKKGKEVVAEAYKAYLLVGVEGEQKLRLEQEFTRREFLKRLGDEKLSGQERTLLNMEMVTKLAGIEKEITNIYQEENRKRLLGWAGVLEAQWNDIQDLTKRRVEAEKAAGDLIAATQHKFALEKNREDDAMVREMEERGARFSKTFLDEVQQARAAAKAMAEAQHVAVEKMAGSIESFIDRVFIQARSLSDVFHQFLMQLLGSFVKWVSQMIARAILGMKQLSGAQAGGIGGGGGGFGNILGSILGGMFGVTAGGGTAAAAAFPGLALPGGGIIQGVTPGLSPGAIGVWGGGGSAMTASMGIPTAAGGAAGAPSAAQAAAGMAAMAGIAFGVPLVASGFTAGTIKQTAIGGAMAGAGIGFMLAGPVGALVGAVWGAEIGALIGWIGRGRAKRKAAALEDQFHMQADEVLDQFKKFKMDYEAALQSVQALAAQFQEAEKQYGGAGRRGAASIGSMAEERLREIRSIQKQREGNLAVMQGMTIPEFQLGGLVSNRNGGILALLHPGEFVMRKEAVDFLGANSLAQVNRAPSFAEGGVIGMRTPALSSGRGIVIHNFAMNIYPAKGMTEREAAQLVARGFRRAVRDGAL